MSAGAELRALLNAALPEGAEWAERESAILDLAVAQADNVAELEEELALQGMTVIGSMGQKRLNPIVTELRLQRRSLASLLSELHMPDEAGGISKDPKKQRAAHAMHDRKAAGGRRLRLVN